jgi:hypothetical protein
MPKPKKILPAKTKAAFIAVTVMLPFLALLLLESGLRIAHYGPDISLCTKTTFHGIDYYSLNSAVRGRYFSSRFFGGKSFSDNATPEYFAMPKPPGTLRIFCLGGSTTAGYPYGVLGSFSRFLQDRLQKLFPKRSVEVINFGITATNSFTVLDMTREVMEYKPDFIIVYDGHNEFYGALGIASRESAGQARWLGLAYMSLTKWKSFLLLNDAIDLVKNIFTTPAAEDVAGTAMERLAKGKHVPYNSSLYTTGLEWYKENMQDAIRICEEKNVPIVFSTQVSNLKDRAPFVSEFSEGTSESARSLFASEYAAGKNAIGVNDVNGALGHLHAAVAADSLRADAHYELARCYDMKGDDSSALAEYAAARDLDQLRFRQSTDFNNAVLALRGKDVFVCDCEKFFSEESPRGLIGGNFILEHLHPTLYGYFLLAKAYARTLRENALITSADEWKKIDTLSDADLWNHRAATPIDEKTGLRRIEVLTSNWPFTTQPVPLPAPTDPVEKLAADVVSHKINWEKATVMAAEYYQTLDSIDLAASCYRELMVHTPFNVSPYLRLSQMLVDHGREDEGTAVLTRSLTIEPSQLAYQLLGRVAYGKKKYDEALQWLAQSKDHASSIQERTDASMGLALTYFAMGRTAEAIAEAEYILTFNSGSESTHRFLDYVHSLSK